MSKYLEDTLSEEELKDWEEKMLVPLSPVKLTEDELQQLRKEGKIN